MYFLSKEAPSRTVLDGQRYLNYGKFFVNMLIMKKKIIFIIFVLIVCAGLAFYFYKKLSPKTQKGVKIEPVAITNNKPTVNIPLPNLNKEIKITADMNEDAKRIATAKIQDLSSQLKKDSDNLENWLVLGVYRKMIGDYESAKEV